jgi:hypothetical protein
VHPEGKLTFNILADFFPRHDGSAIQIFRADIRPMLSMTANQEGYSVRPRSCLQQNAFVSRDACGSRQLEEITSGWHITEYLEHVKSIAGNARPAKRNRADIPENGQKTLGTLDGGPLVDATHRPAGDDIVVNRDKWQCRKSRELARHSPASSPTPGLAAFSGQLQPSRPMSMTTPQPDIGCF